MGVFGNKIGKAKVTGGGEYFDKVGNFVVEIEVVKAIETQEKGPMFCAETIVVQSDNDEIPVGARRSYCSLANAKWGPANIKEFVVAANGLNAHEPKDEKAIDAKDWDAITEEAISETNPLKGDKLLIVVYSKKTKAGTMGTRTKCLPYTKKEVTK